MIKGLIFSKWFWNLKEKKIAMFVLLAFGHGKLVNTGTLIGYNNFDLYSETCIEIPLSWYNTCLEGPRSRGRTYSISA